MCDKGKICRTHPVMLLPSVITNLQANNKLPLPKKNLHEILCTLLRYFQCNSDQQMSLSILLIRSLVTPETFFGAQSLPVKPKFYPFCSTFLSGFYSSVNPLKCENEFTNICEWTQKRTQKFLWIIQKPFIFLTLENVYYIQVICVTDATIIEKLHSRISGEEEQLKEPEPYKSSSANKTRRMAIVTPARSELN